MNIPLIELIEIREQLSYITNEQRKVVPMEKLIGMAKSVGRLDFYIKELAKPVSTEVKE